MSESITSVAGYEEDCPLCFEPLPPFWADGGRNKALCCSKETCDNCCIKRIEFLSRAEVSGSWGREEDQLNECCPFCRTNRKDVTTVVSRLLGAYEQNKLPLTEYWELGIYFINGRHGLTQNVAKGKDVMLQGAEKGDPRCQYHVGNGYLNAKNGLPKSQQEAKRWFLAAAERGHASAEYNLALMMREEGNFPDYLRYMWGAALKGENAACFSLGSLYYLEKRRADPDEAIRALKPAAERGHAPSMGLLGMTLCSPLIERMDPPDTNPNFAKGMHWLRRAAETGDEDQCSQLKYFEKVASSKCFCCGKEVPPEIALLRCSRCRAAWYCSKDCQVQHWKAEEGGHKQFCIKWRPQKDVFRQIIAASANGGR